MSRRDFPTTSLADVSEAVPHMSEEDRNEMAGFGALVDWELVKLMSRAEWDLVSLSFKWRDDEVLLVGKVKMNGAQYVVFVSRSSPIDCVRTLVRKMRDGALALYPDKFA